MSVHNDKPTYQTPSLAYEMAESDTRQLNWREQREVRGFDGTELWNLDRTFAVLMLPRLKAFKAKVPDNPNREDHAFTHATLQTIIIGLELLASDQGCNLNDEQQVLVSEALQKFANNIQSYWL